MKLSLEGDIKDGIISSGYLLISYKNMKGYVCADNWLSETNNMKVACGHLGFPAAVKLRAMRSDWTFILNGVECQGTESSLLSCSHTGFGQEKQQCQGNTAVWLECSLFSKTAKFKNVSQSVTSFS